MYLIPPTLQPLLETITLVQYETLPKSRRVEVFDGIAYDMASPSQIHQTISMELSNITKNILLQKLRCSGILDCGSEIPDGNG